MTPHTSLVPPVAAGPRAAPGGVALGAASSLSSLLALADQRLPTGGHVHSGGVEQAVADGTVWGVGSLCAFLERRLCTAGLVAAGLAAAAVDLVPGEVGALDAEADARCPSPAQRGASRAQGRGLLRLVRETWTWPHEDLCWEALGPRPHHPIVLGCAARAAGLDASCAALVAAYLCVTGPSTAAQRLLALDPVAVAAATLRLGERVEAVARSAVAAVPSPGAARDGPRTPRDFRDLPDDSDPLLDLLAERHAARTERLFAS